MSRYTFGPVPSRRLGRSLGVNNIPYKHCSYSCVYCQLGRTLVREVERRFFYPPREVAGEVVERVSNLRGEVDYVTFVPDGEPTLDLNLGVIAEAVKREVDVPLAVLSNTSLVYREDVQSDLEILDLVSLKLDTVVSETWLKVNRPHPRLRLGEVIWGLEEFSKRYRGTLILETMLVRGVNDTVEEAEGIAELLSRVRFSKLYLAIPTRPPAESWAKPTSEERLVAVYQVLSERLGDRVELLTGYEGPDFVVSGDPVGSLLNILSVHPMRLDYAYRLLERFGLDAESAVGRLVEKGDVKLVEYRGYRFLVKSFPKKPSEAR
ncbi:radical SAM protein [Candidatus Bathyarchaeota archaeon]|nr:MAG: radical SAM protein [Candidatus Bathyarchaeota archaeon]